MNNGFKYGVMYGLISSIIVALQYFMFPESITSPINWVISIGLPLLFMWMAAKKERDDQSGIISFGEALVPAFLTNAVGGLMYTLVGFALLKLVPGLLETQAEIAGQAAETMGQKMKDLMPDSTQELDLAAMKQETIDATMNMGFGTMMINWLFGMVFALIPALIIAAIVKRNPSA